MIGKVITKKNKTFSKKIFINFLFKILFIKNVKL
jgi:hypothetical protein